MASVVTTKSGREKGLKRISFIGLDKRRREIRVGRISNTQAQLICHHIEAIIRSLRYGVQLEKETDEWIKSLPNEFYRKLAHVGLTLPRAADTPSVAEIIDRYIKYRGKVKPQTLTVWHRVKRYLVRHFESQPVGTITESDAWGFWVNLEFNYGLSDATARKACSVAIQFFQYAVATGVITSNPFRQETIKTNIKPNVDRFHFVTKEDAAKILDACPSQEWRVIFTLSRWGGLRCPSEHLALKWKHVDWVNDRLTVPSPKTAHIPGHEQRVIPLFPRLRKELEALFAEAEPGEWIITRYRDGCQNLRTTFERIILRAGVKPWPKLFHNLRSTRATELSGRISADAVCKLLGFSLGAANHYLHHSEEMLKSLAFSESFAE